MNKISSFTAVYELFKNKKSKKTNLNTSPRFFYERVTSKNLIYNLIVYIIFFLNYHTKLLCIILSCSSRRNFFIIIFKNFFLIKEKKTPF